MISIPSFAPSASKPHDKDAKREQNPRYTRYNSLTRAETFQDTYAKEKMREIAATYEELARRLERESGAADKA